MCCIVLCIGATQVSLCMCNHVIDAIGSFIGIALLGSFPDFIYTFGFSLEILF